MPDNSNFIDEKNIPDNWAPKDVPAIIPGRAPLGAPAPPVPHDMPQFFSGSIAPVLQHDGSFVATEMGSPRIPKTALMPLGNQANPSTNAAAQSTAKTVAQQVVKAQPPSSSGVTSVGLTMPSIFVAPVSGSPITSAGVLAPALGPESFNTFFAGPTSAQGSVTLDTAAQNSGTGTLFSVSTPSTTANDFAILAIPDTASFAFTVTGPDASWNVINPVPTGGIGCGIFWKNVVASGTVTGNGSFSSSQTWAACLATIQVTGGGTPAVRQSKVGGSGTTSVALTSNTLAGSAIFVIVGGSWAEGTAAFLLPVTISDTQGNSYAQLVDCFKANGNTGIQAYVFAVPSSAAGALTVSVNLPIAPGSSPPAPVNFSNSTITILEVTNLGTPSFIPSFRKPDVSDIPSLPASQITSGQLLLARGGTSADLSGTGGTNQVLRQSTAGAAITVSQLANNNLLGYAATSQKSESAADTNVLTFTPPATAGSYRLRFVMSVSAATAATLGWTATWRDSNGNVQTPVNLALFQTGVAPSALTFTTSAAGNYYGQLDIDINNAATNIVIQLTFAGTSFAAKVSATIERII